MVASGLDDFHDAAWSALSESEGTNEAALRVLALSTLGRDGAPQSRSVILRAVDVAPRACLFHTDIRSEKWHELSAFERVSVLGYDGHRRLQIRLTGRALLSGPGTALQAEHWRGLSPWTRTTYCGGPPGIADDAVREVTFEPDQTPTEAQTSVGEGRFGVVSVTAKGMDVFEHRRGNLRRARFCYDETGVRVSGQWVLP
jgi:pyridoxamine 5'-phosphate oxidase